MDNFSLFLDGFMKYFVTYFVFIVAIIAAFLIGFGLRKSKNAKEGISTEAETVEEKEE